MADKVIETEMDTTTNYQVILKAYDSEEVMGEVKTVADMLALAKAIKKEVAATTTSEQAYVVCRQTGTR